MWRHMCFFYMRRHGAGSWATTGLYRPGPASPPTCAFIADLRAPVDRQVCTMRCLLSCGSSVVLVFHDCIGADQTPWHPNRQCRLVLYGTTLMYRGHLEGPFPFCFCCVSAGYAAGQKLGLMVSLVGSALLTALLAFLTLTGLTLLLVHGNFAASCHSSSPIHALASEKFNLMQDWKKVEGTVS